MAGAKIGIKLTSVLAPEAGNTGARSVSTGRKGKGGGMANKRKLSFDTDIKSSILKKSLSGGK